ncbi:MAG: glycosyltransferase [bacterium]|nr:glycosyltransferase [bacterium]
MTTNLTVLYFGVYEPSYARNWVLINGLRKNGVTVFECRENPKNRLKFFSLFFKYWKFVGKFDVMVVGFPGQEIMFLARLLAWGKPIIFDAFTSHYGGYILDRKRWRQNSLRAWYYRFLDKWSCKLADVVLLDTNAHINFFVKEFNLPKKKFRRIWAGANDNIFQPFYVDQGEPVQNHYAQEKFNVLFFGTYIPLQGVEYIVRAAKILEQEKDILFTLVGNGQERSKTQELSLKLGLKNVVFKDMMSLEKLKNEVADGDISLGIFGRTQKASIVIPNKVFMGLAMKKPVITADTEAIRELFNDEDMFLISPANEQELAQVILKIKNNPALGEKIAQNGYDKFIKFASHQILGRELKNIINDQRSPLSG